VTETGDERPAVSLETVFATVIEGYLDDLHVALPGRVTKFDATTQKASVEPTIGRRFGRYGDRVDEILPVLTNVPVVWPRGGGFVLQFPLTVGDFVLLVFSERSYDEWLTKGGSRVVPQAERRHHLTDAVAIAGVYPDPDVLSTNVSNGIDLWLGQSVKKGEVNPLPKRLQVGPSGIGLGDGTNDLLGIVDDLLTLLSSTPQTLPSGSVNPAFSAALVPIIASLAAIKRP